MSVLDRLLGIVGLQKAGPKLEELTENPKRSDVPYSWITTFLGPGMPVTPIPTGAGADYRSRVDAKEPRSFQYTPQANAIISPRAAYGLKPFAQLRDFAENVPEVARCVRLLTDELRSFEPEILDPNGKRVVDDDDILWMVGYPDGATPWSIWLSRFLYNVLVYDAGCCYMVRNEKEEINSLRIVDGSTIMPLIDARGEIPEPPAPAYTQIIWGVPKQWFNAYQLWYRPRHLRADAPYGRAPVEDCVKAVEMLRNLWDYEADWWTVGSLPDQFLTAPNTADWGPEKCTLYQNALNGKIGGNSQEKRRITILPAGFGGLPVTPKVWSRDTYEAALEVVGYSFGIPQSELGRTPGIGLGGTGYAQKMESQFFRMGIAPLKAYIEQLFNYVLAMNHRIGYRYQLAYPPEEINSEQREEQWLSRWETGLARRNEARQGMGMAVDKDAEAGNVYSFDAQAASAGAMGGIPGMPTPGGQSEGGQAEEEVQPEESVPTGKLLKGESLSGQLCPYEDCHHNLAFEGNGFHRCPACGRIFYAEESDEDYNAYPLERLPTEVAKPSEKLLEFAGLAGDLGASWATPRVSRNGHGG